MISFLLFLLAVLLPYCSGYYAFLNADVPAAVVNGTPGVDPAFECAWRSLAYEQARKILPRKAAFLQAFDALKLHTGCGVPRPPTPPPTPFPLTPLPSIATIYVDYDHGDDGNPGSVEAPLKTIAAAVQQRAAIRAAAAIVLRQGIHVLNASIQLTPAHSNTIIQNYPSEQVVITGARPIATPQWRKVAVAFPGCADGFCVMPDSDGVLPANYSLNGTTTATPAECQRLCAANSSCLTYTWLPTNKTCWFRTDPHIWIPTSKTSHVAGCKSGMLLGCPGQSNIYVADISALHLSKLQGLHAVRRSNSSALQLSRKIWARHPNCDPENNAILVFGGTGWIPPKSAGCDSQVVNQTNLPDNYPGMFQNYSLGVGGSCDMFEVDNASYWCQPWGRTGGPEKKTYCARVPQGLYYRGSDLPNVDANFTRWHGAQAVVFRGAGEWFTWTFELAGYNHTNKTIYFGRGGFQGAEGSDVGSRWWIEGVLELLDSPEEFFYDVDAGLLYYWPNTTADPPSEGEALYATVLEELFLVTGAQSQPVVNVTFAGVAFTGASRTDLAPHGVPSAGDYALEERAALHVEGTEGLTVANCTFERLDGNGILARGYNRRLSILENDFAYIGNSAVILWGRTNFSDGTLGDQPLYSLIYGNLFTDVGVYQKGSPAYLQAKSAFSRISGNVLFNMPRAGINFNDGFGGGSEVSWNLLFNTCRESSDNGPFNSWAREPFVTTFRHGRPSVEPVPNEIHHNFNVGNYQADAGGADTDDGSSWYDIHDNFFVYGGHKSDFTGHGKRSYNNIHAYAQVYRPACADWQSLPNASPTGYFNEGYYNNTCILSEGARYFGIGGGCHSAWVLNSTFWTLTTNNNRIYVKNFNATVYCGDIKNATQWLAYGRDRGTQIFDQAKAADIIDWARSLVGNVPW